MQDGGLLPTFDERRVNADNGGIGYGTGKELVEHSSHAGDDEEAPKSKAGTQQRVFRVTTLEDQDYDSIPHQRLKAVIGSESWARRLLLWVLMIVAIFGIVCLFTFMHAKQKFQRAHQISLELSHFDTSKNDAVAWLKSEKHAPERAFKFPTMGHPKPVKHTVPTNNPRNPLKLAGIRPRQLPIPAAHMNNADLLRLPVGLATTLYIERMVKSEEFNQDITPGHDSRYSELMSLRQTLPVDLYQSTADKQVHIDLLRLLRVARRAGLVTEVPLERGTGAVSSQDRFMGHDRSRKELLKQLKRFVACTHKGAQVPCSKYKDIMRYPDSAALLYWGTFSLLQFDGIGVLYWRNGLPAYNGTWHNGVMEGHGVLTNSNGERMWEGKFANGYPEGSLHELWTNYFV